MLLLKQFACLSLLLAPPLALAGETGKQSQLTPQEIAEGWLLLFDGESTFGWTIEGEGVAADGKLVLGPKKTVARTNTKFGDYELKLEIESNEFSGKLLFSCGKGKGSIGIFSQPHSIHLKNKVQNSLGQEIELKVGPDRVATMVGNVSTDRPVPIEIEADGKMIIRSVKLRPLGLKPIFNGKDLSGWKEFPGRKSKFSVGEKGELNVRDGPGDLQTVAQWDDFVLQLECISHGPHLNSGIFFRCIPDQYQQGYEAQIRNQWMGDDRTKPVDFGTGAIYRRQAARRVVSTDREWFTMTLIAQGNHFATWVNGYQVADWTDTRPPRPNAREGCNSGKGSISIQGHDPTTDLSFRNLRIGALAH